MDISLIYNSHDALIYHIVLVMQFNIIYKYIYIPANELVDMKY